MKLVKHRFIIWKKVGCKIEQLLKNNKKYFKIKMINEAFWIREKLTENLKIKYGATIV